eukprot:4765260-Pyramimonas_sp.AAC.1
MGSQRTRPKGPGWCWLPIRVCCRIARYGRRSSGGIRRSSKGRSPPPSQAKRWPAHRQRQRS